MPKVKTHRASAKRFRVTGSGLIIKNKAGRRHDLGKKTSKRKRNMRKADVVAKADAKVVRQLIPYK
ncbi:MAG TPA: 50S ribosomal protein L35 [Bacillota bacterium]|jgi:large subunit ribosomal protein L35|nr:50S ribosomal protein L35 [Bacillota bacterium]HNU95114.1 50S ribosomal protein L35 [Bacillota bacterium]HNY68821.1 50S ribosomal protein L35 [Bacillota bacterium]HOI38625.1 50S ribosomal protein L35 [Bacillota bacterium]HPU76450.1 50S ribosomal protein L35 [Bacillota bacterium]